MKKGILYVHYVIFHDESNCYNQIYFVKCFWDLSIPLAAGQSKKKRSASVLVRYICSPILCYLFLGLLWVEFLRKRPVNVPTTVVVSDWQVVISWLHTHRYTPPHTPLFTLLPHWLFSSDSQHGLEYLSCNYSYYTVFTHRQDWDYSCELIEGAVSCWV